MHLIINVNILLKLITQIIHLKTLNPDKNVRGEGQPDPDPRDRLQGRAKCRILRFPRIPCFSCLPPTSLLPPPPPPRISRFLCFLIFFRNEIPKNHNNKICLETSSYISRSIIGNFVFSQGFREPNMQIDPVGKEF